MAIFRRLMAIFRRLMAIFRRLKSPIIGSECPFEPPEKGQSVDGVRDVLTAAGYFLAQSAVVVVAVVDRHVFEPLFIGFYVFCSFAPLVLLQG